MTSLRYNHDVPSGLKICDHETTSKLKICNHDFSLVIKIHNHVVPSGLFFNAEGMS
jgi:hypothetical protein